MHEYARACASLREASSGNPELVHEHRPYCFPPKASIAFRCLFFFLRVNPPAMPSGLRNHPPPNAYFAQRAPVFLTACRWSLGWVARAPTHTSARQQARPQTGPRRPRPETTTASRPRRLGRQTQKGKIKKLACRRLQTPATPTRGPIATKQQTADRCCTSKNRGLSRTFSSSSRRAGARCMYVLCGSGCNKLSRYGISQRQRTPSCVRMGCREGPNGRWVPFSTFFFFFVRLRHGSLAMLPASFLRLVAACGDVVRHGAAR